MTSRYQDNFLHTSRKSGNTAPTTRNTSVVPPNTPPEKDRSHKTSKWYNPANIFKITPDPVNPWASDPFSSNTISKEENRKASVASFTLQDQRRGYLGDADHYGGEDVCGSYYYDSEEDDSDDCEWKVICCAASYTGKELFQKSPISVDKLVEMDDEQYGVAVDGTGLAVYDDDITADARKAAHKVHLEEHPHPRCKDSHIELLSLDMSGRAAEADGSGL